MAAPTVWTKGWTKVAAMVAWTADGTAFRRAAKRVTPSVVKMVGAKAATMVATLDQQSVVQ